MSRVIAFEDILYLGVPKPEDFETAKEVFFDAATPHLESRALSTAAVFGSVAVGSAGPRSDMDVLLSTDQSKQGREAGRDVIQAVRRSTGDRIPVNAIVKPAEHLRTGNHEMDQYFVQHLMGQDVRLIGRGLEIDAKPKTPQDVLEGFLSQKIRKLENAHSSDTEQEIMEAKNLSRMLDLPVAVGRKTVQAFGEIRPLGTAGFETSDRQSVKDTVRKLLEELGTEGGFDALIDIDAAYSAALESAMSGDLNRSEYSEILLAIHAQMPIAIDWLYRLKHEVQKYEL